MQNQALIKALGLSFVAIGAVQAYRMLKANEYNTLLSGGSSRADNPGSGETPEETNVRAFLWMIRNCEGTAGARGYNTLYGYEYFEDFSTHPNRKICKNGYCSTAAGAYQILYSTWLWAKASISGLTDFSPANQDKIAVWLIDKNNALADVKAGRFAQAVQKCARTWASLPGYDEGQPNKSFAEAQSYYLSAGGQLA